MNHPSDLLADLMDGTLDADARARVEAHLSACASCRGDLAAASAGREALRSLGAAPAPSDLGDRIAAAASGRGDAASGPPRWYRWAGVAAAAALVAVIAFSLPDVGDGGSADRAGGFGSVGSAVGTASAEEGVTLEVRPDVDYQQEDLARLAADARSTGAPEAHAVAADADEAFGTASACVTGAFAQQPSGRIVRLIRARFQGRPAYVAVYLEGPGAGQDPDTATVWVAALDDCSILSFAQARI